MGRTRIYADDAARARAWRARRRLDRAGAPPDRPPLGNDAWAVVEWAAGKLRVPTGHPRSGEPFNLADLQIAIIDDVLTHRETLACMARKNAKSATIAVLALAHLAARCGAPDGGAGY